MNGQTTATATARVHQGVEQEAAAHRQAAERGQAARDEQSKVAHYTAEDFARMTAHEKVQLGCGAPLPLHRVAQIKARDVQLPPPPPPPRHEIRRLGALGVLRRPV